MINHFATQNLSISGSKVTRRFYVERSAISRATQKESRDPELPLATKKIQIELEKNQH